MLEKTLALQLREDFLGAMSTVANSVTVVTTSGPAGMGGATVSSFCSVSADPPMLLVCLNKTAYTSEIAQKNGQFSISILPETSSTIAMKFADSKTDKANLLEGEEWLRSEDHAPVLKGVNAFCCNITEIAEASSHHVLIGEVTKVFTADQKPLVYLNRNFCRTTPL